MEDAAGATADELIAEAERLQGAAGLRHRKVEVQQGGDGLADGFTAAGWTAEALVVMVLRGRDQRGDVPRTEVREVGFEVVRGLLEQWYGESMSAAEAAELTESDADATKACGARWFAAIRDGEAAACCQLLGADCIGQVEQVYTAAAHRGHGLATLLIRVALAASHTRGDDFGMILADADDWPQRLYERLGFVTVDRYRTFTKRPR